MEVEHPECWTTGLLVLQSFLPSPGPSMELVLAVLLQTQSLVVVGEEHSNYFLPSCREEAVPMISPLVVEVDDSSNCQNFHYCHSCVVPRAAGLTDSSEVWQSLTAGLPLLPSHPSWRRSPELAELVSRDQNSDQRIRQKVWLPDPAPLPHRGEVGLHHQAQP